MLKIENIHTYYGGIRALKGITLEICEGETVCLIGANGAGKTTTIMTICGIRKPVAGDIFFMGEKISKSPPYIIYKKGITQIPEGRFIIPFLTVEENLSMGAYLRRDKKEIEDDLENTFSIFPILKERKKQLGATLSGGEQQMLAIARGLMSRPKCLLLDEPSLGLAPIFVQKIYGMMKNIKKMGITIFLVEQNAKLALSFSDRGYVIETGRIVKQGVAKELLGDGMVKEIYLGG